MQLLTQGFSLHFSPKLLFSLCSSSFPLSFSAHTFLLFCFLLFSFLSSLILISISFLLFRRRSVSFLLYLTPFPYFLSLFILYCLFLCASSLPFKLSFCFSVTPSHLFFSFFLSLDTSLSLLTYLFARVLAFPS